MLSNSLRTRLLSAVSLIPMVVLDSQFRVATWRASMSSSLRLAICRLVECPEFRDLLNYINNYIDTWLPVSHTTITDWVLRQFNSMKENMKSRLRSACTDIHISCDLWTSPNCLPILGVVAQYISEDGKLE